MFSGIELNEEVESISTAENKDSSLGVSNLPPEKVSENIHFDNWLWFRANAVQIKRHNECVNILIAKHLKTGFPRKAAIYRAYCWIRAPQYRHRYIHYIVTGV